MQAQQGGGQGQGISQQECSKEPDRNLEESLSLFTGLIEYLALCYMFTFLILYILYKVFKSGNNQCALLTNGDSEAQRSYK